MHKNRHIDQWTGIESLEINPHLYSQLIFNRRRKHIQWAKDILFNKWYWENWTDTCRTMKLDQHFTPHTRINSKWTKDLNIRSQAIKILEENIGSKISDTACNNFLSDVSPQARETKKKINNFGGLHQTKKFLHSKGNHQQNKKTTHRMGQHICQYI